MNFGHFDTLKAISKNLDKESYLKIYETVRKLGITGVIEFEIPPENIFVIRALERNNTHFENINQISFNPNPSSYNRANRPGLKVFYGSLQVPGKENPVISNIYELIEISKNELFSNKTNVIKLIIGAWKLKRKIPSMPIIYNTETLNKIDIFKPLLVNYKKKQHPDNLEVLEFISSEFAKETFRNQFAYQISAAFSEFLFVSSAQNGHAILYPSVRSNQGVNIAIRADKVYDYLEPAHIWTTDLYLKNNIILSDYLEYTDKIDKAGNFKLIKSTDSESNQGYEKSIKKLNGLLSKKD